MSAGEEHMDERNIIDVKITSFRIFAIDEKGIEEEITDLYWFEENGVHDFSGDGPYTKYKFRFVFGAE